MFLLVVLVVVGALSLFGTQGHSLGFSHEYRPWRLRPLMWCIVCHNWWGQQEVWTLRRGYNITFKTEWVVVRLDWLNSVSRIIIMSRNQRWDTTKRKMTQAFLFSLQAWFALGERWRVIGEVREFGRVFQFLLEGGSGSVWFFCVFLYVLLILFVLWIYRPFPICSSTELDSTSDSSVFWVQLY